MSLSDIQLLTALFTMLARLPRPSASSQAVQERVDSGRRTGHASSVRRPVL